MSQSKVCKSCSGELDEFQKDEIIKEGFCPYCVDRQGKVKSYGDILEGMLEYIRLEHKEIEKKDRLLTAHQWLAESEVWKEKYADDEVVIDIVRKGDLGRIDKHEHKKEGFSHSCGECMYYQGCDDSVFKKEEWLRNIEEKHGTCANVVYYKKDLVGFIQYAPKTVFPKLEEETLGSTETGNWYISCIYIDFGIESKERKRLVKLCLEYVIKDLKNRGLEAVQISAPIEKETLSSTPFDWDFYKKIGFIEVSRDSEWVLGKIKLK